MTEVNYFNTSQQLDKALFESFLKDNFNSHNFIWITNFYNYASDNELDDKMTYVSVEETSTEGFKYEYSVYDNNIELPLRERIEIIKKLSAKTNLNILSTDDEIDPWSWVLIESNGESSTIHVKDDVFDIGEYYNFPFGDFRTIEKLNQFQIEKLKELIKPLYFEIEVDYATDGPIINGDFNKVKANFEKLKKFDNHYEIRPIGKAQWFDREEKSEHFVLMMNKFQKIIKKDLCIFPRNFSYEKKVESDSYYEEYCILLTALEQERIVYTQTQKTWLF